MGGGLLLRLCCVLGAARGSTTATGGPSVTSAAAAAEQLVRAGDVEGARRLLEGGQELLPQGTVDFLLCEAAYRGRAEMVSLLVGAGAANVAYIDTASESRTALHYVIAGFDEANRYGHGAVSGDARYAATVRVLLKAQAPLGARDARGMTPLHAAARARFSRALRLMAPAAGRAGGSAIELRTGGPDVRLANMTALLLVASGLRHSLMLLATTWLKQPKPAVTGEVRHSAFKAWGLEIERASYAFAFEPNTTVRRPQLEESLSKWSCDLMRPLIRANASVTAAGTLGWEALHYAADFGDLALIALLVDAGANVSSRNNDGMLPIDLAWRHSHDDAVAALHAIGSPPVAVSRRPKQNTDSCADAKTGAAGAIEHIGKRFGRRVVEGLRPETICEIQSVPMDSVTPEKLEEYLGAQEPLLLTNSSEVHALAKRWTWVDLIEQYGEAVFETSAIPYAGQYGLPHRRQSLRECLADAATAAAPDTLFEHKLQGHHPALLKDIETLRLFAGFRIHPHQFLVGPVGSGAPFHFHQDAYNALVQGTKRWFFRRPSQATMSTEHPLTTVANRPEGMACTQRAGDVMYVPDSYSHLVLNMEASVALAVEFYPGLLIKSR